MSREDIIEGMSRALWVSAYADYVEGLSKQERIDAGTPVSLQGIDWWDDSPATPEVAEKAGLELAALYEAENDVSLDELSRRAGMAANLRMDLAGRDENFGYYLAMMAMGSGVSWFDHHKHFEIKQPMIETHYDGEFFDWSGRCKTSYKNPAGLTRKGERMYKHIKGTYEKVGDIRAKEIASRTVLARAKHEPGLKRKNPPTKQPPLSPPRPPGAPPMYFQPMGRPPGVPNPRHGNPPSTELGHKYVLGTYAPGSRVQLGVWKFPAARRSKIVTHRDDPGGSREGGMLMPGDWVTVIRNSATTTGTMTVKNERNKAIEEKDGRAPLFEVDVLRSTRA
jgi:hypothetical protein